MTDLYSLVKDTKAYQTVKTEKASDRLSHAYLILTADGDNLREYLKIFASLVVCDSLEPCKTCRNCNLIEKDAHSDVMFYPRKNEFINVEEISSVIEESYIKPIESNKKVFVLVGAQDMNAQAQNKLLKTLEEPPKNVCILLGATSEFPLLPTIKSRVKKLEIPAFSKEKLFKVLSEEFPDKDRLKNAIACSDGTVGSAKRLYLDKNLQSLTALCCEIITQMLSSKDVLKYSTKITNSKIELEEFFSVLELLYRDMLVGLADKELVQNNDTYLKIKDADGYSNGALINALEKIAEAKKRLEFNANPTMLIEWVLFQILEGKYKWQKL